MYSEQARARAHELKVDELIRSFSSAPYLPYEVMKYAGVVRQLLDPVTYLIGDIDDHGEIRFHKYPVTTIVKAYAFRVGKMYYAPKPTIKIRGGEYWNRKKVPKSGRVPPGGVLVREDIYMIRGDEPTRFKMIQSLEPTPDLFRSRSAQMTSTGAVEYARLFIATALQQFDRAWPEVEDWALTERPYEIEVSQA